MIDLLIAGGGPAGLATALYAAEAGLEAVVVEPRPAPIDKACGEGLMPAAVEALARLGVALRVAHPFVGIRYLDDNGIAEGIFAGRPGLGVRRTVLHAALVERAAAAGVRMIEGRIAAFEQDERSVGALGLRARWGVVADGLCSPLRRGLGLALPPRRPARIGVRRHFRTRPWSDFVEVWWAEQGEAYVTPVAEDQVGVAILCGDEAGGDGGLSPFDRRLAWFPRLRERLGEPCSQPRGAGPFEQRVRSRVAGRVLLVGDAAGYLDPLTGEGIRMGLAAAERLIAAVRADRPADYERAWRRLARPSWWGTAALLWCGRHAWFRRRIVNVPRRIPWIMDRGLHLLGG